MASSDAAARSQNVLLRLLKQTDGNMLRFAKLISTTGNADTVWLTLSYTLHFVHATLERLTAARLAAAATQLADKLSTSAPGALLPGEALVATIETAPDSRLLRAEQSTSAFLKSIDDFRTFNRLKTLINIWAWGSNTLRHPNADPALQSIALTQVSACAVYAVLENTAYLASKGVWSVGGDATRVPKMFLWSARAWTLHVLLEFVRLWRVAAIRENHSSAAGGTAEKARKKEDEAWWAAFWGNAAWAPLAVSWSLGSNGFAGEGMIATLGGAAGWMSLVRAWRATVV